MTGIFRELSPVKFLVCYIKYEFRRATLTAEMNQRILRKALSSSSIMASNNGFLSPHSSTSSYRHRSPSASSSCSTSSRLPPRPSLSTSRSSRTTTTITTLTPSTSSYTRRKSSVCSIASSSTSTTTTATSISTQRGDKENVQVIVRCRPMTQQEFLDYNGTTAAGSHACWEVSPEHSRIRLTEHGQSLQQRRREGRRVEYYFGMHSRNVSGCPLLFLLRRSFTTTP